MQREKERERGTTKGESRRRKEKKDGQHEKEWAFVIVAAEL